MVAQPEPVKPVEPAAPALVKLTFTSEPAGAEVLESDLTLGNTPFALERKPGEIIQVTFKLKGYKDETKKVRFESDATVKVDLQKVGGPPRPKPAPTPGNPYEQEEDLKDNPF